MTKPWPGGSSLLPGHASPATDTRRDVGLSPPTGHHTTTTAPKGKQMTQMTPEQELRDRAISHAMHLHRHDDSPSPEAVLATAASVERFLTDGLGSPAACAAGLCPCGHALSWHTKRPGVGYGRGCQSKDLNVYKSDLYGFCPCPVSA